MKVLFLLAVLATLFFVSCNKAHYPPYAIQEFDDVDMEILNK